MAPFRPAHTHNLIYQIYKEIENPHMTVAIMEPTTPRLRRQASMVKDAPKITPILTPVKGKTVLATETASTRWFPSMSVYDWRVLSTVTALAFIVRLFALNHPSVVMYYLYVLLIIVLMRFILVGSLQSISKMSTFWMFILHLLDFW